MNRKVVFSLAILALLCLLSAGNGVRLVSATRSQSDALAAAGIDQQTYLRKRAEHVGRLRGLSPGVAFDGRRRDQAIKAMERQERALREAVNGSGAGTSSPDVLPTWVELGPRPLPNGDTQQPGVKTAVSGRATAVVVDPSNANNVYLGTAQGGVWRSTDGGNSWTPIFDSAQSLAIGSLALAPSSPTTLYVGTGEQPGNIINDAFFGVGVYRIDNADTTATLAGPINPTQTFTSIFDQPIITTSFGGRAITKILVHPTNPAIVFVTTAGSFSGISGLTIGSELPPLGLRGLYRSTNATAAPGSVTFEKLTVTTDASFDQPGTGNTAVWDIAFEPANPNTMLATVAGSFQDGGVFRSTNVLAANPTFTQTLSTSHPDGLGMKLATSKVGGVVTVYVTSNEPSSCPGEDGRLRKSIDGGMTWTDVPAADGFCGSLCIYSDPIAIDPNNPNLIYLGGTARGACADVLKRSTDGGASFSRDDTGLSADAHALFIDTSTSPVTVWFAGDGGVWRRQDMVPGTAWDNKNNSSLGTLQFQSVAVHPTDRNFTIGGTEDNGTEAQQTTPGNWTSAEGGGSALAGVPFGFGDTGYALIDQSANDTNNVTMYHTFFNLTNVLIGFSRTNLGGCLSVKDSWEFRGAGVAADPSSSCDGTAKKATNGLNIADNVNFYAPMALGPGTPNTLYFGTDKLYRSTDRGDTMNAVSQGPLSGTTPVSAIGISRTNDNVRLVGMSDGRVFATFTGATTLTENSPTLGNDPNGPPFPNLKYISRAVIDRDNPNIAYITLSYYAEPGFAVFKTTNLNLADAGTVTWTAMSNGIPSIPVNAFVIDPANSNRLFAGTDIGVYVSEDGGANWAPYGTGLPRASVFDMAIQPTSRTLRVATHGRGMWETIVPAAIKGTVVYAHDIFKNVPNVTMTLTGTNNFTTQIQNTDSNGKYAFTNLVSGIGHTYTLTPSKASEVHDSSITAFDASLAARFAANVQTLTAIQQIAADASNNGSVSAFDASLIARYQASIPAAGSIAGSWKFLPPSLTHNDLISDAVNQIQSVLVGDVSGNWVPPSGPVPLPLKATATSPVAPGVTIVVSLPFKQDAPGPTTIPISVGDTTGQGIGSFAMDISFDSSVLQPQATPYDTAGTLSSGWLITPNTATTGHLILNGFSTTDMAGQGIMLNLKFNVVGAGGAQTPLTWVNFTFNEGNPGDTDINGQFTVGAPTAANGRISGQIVTSSGQPVSGATVTVSGGARTLKTITDSEGRYQVVNVETNRVYTVIPARANYTFAPAERSFSLLGDKTDAVFTGTSSGDAVNPVDTAEYFVRQQYLDILGREPDQGGFEYWSAQLQACGGAADCVQASRVNIASAFFIEQEFRQSGAFIYNLYREGLGRRPQYPEYAAERRTVVGGATLEAQQQAFAAAFVARAEFASRYAGNTTAESFVDALLANVRQASGVDLSSERASLIARYQTGTSQNESRTLVLREVTESAAVREANYNGAFLAVEYFGYLHRNPEPAGYDFWLNVLNQSGSNGNPTNYRGMVCSFITSTEYQRRFSAVVSHSNAECGQ